MKLLKPIVALMLLSVIVFSCKKDKKEEVTTDEVVVEEVVVEDDSSSEAATEEAPVETEISVVYPKDAELARETANAIKSLVKDNPSLKEYFNSAHGFVVFHKIDKGGLVIGGAAGKGLTFEDKTVVGKSHMSQATIGAQAGGQTYMEVIFFENKITLDKFKEGKLKFSGQASAIALEQGTSVDLKYQDGVSIFTKGIGGLMAEAAVGGQKFKYEDGI